MFIYGITWILCENKLQNDLLDWLMLAMSLLFLFFLLCSSTHTLAFINAVDGESESVGS